MKHKFISRILTIVLSVVTVSGLASCGTKKIEYIDDQSVRLNLDYKGKDFYKDGVAEVTLKTCIDGDTAHFSPIAGSSNMDTIKSRFFGIDTPESTGKVEPYGKAASNFTKEKLKTASEKGTIVVSSAQDYYGKPNPDSTGERYVTLIWVCLDKKNADVEDLRLLNLWLVQEGYSYVKNVEAMPQYAEIFDKAEAQAEKLKLVMFSGEDDPLFNYGDYSDVSLLDIKREVEKSLADSSYENPYNNVKIRIQGTVAGYANHILYLQNYYTKDQGAKYDEGEYAGINIFCGMSAVPSKFTKKNTYIELCGLAQDSENFGFQVTDVYSFNILGKNENDTKVIISAEDNVEEHKLYTFQYAAKDLKEANYDSLFCSVQITDTVEVRSIYKASNSEITLYLKDADFSIYISFMYTGTDDSYWTEEENFVGKKFKVTGVYTFHKGSNSGKISWQINPSNSSELVCVTE